MLLLDIPRLASRENRYVEIPFYHRPHLFLPQQNKMSLCLLPNQSIRALNKVEPAVPELIAAPFDFARWDCLWRFTATLADREGLLRDLFRIVTHQGGEVMSSESGTSQEEGIHVIESIIYVPTEVDARRIEWLLGAQFCRDVVFSSDRRTRLQIRRIETLFQAKQRYEALSALPVSGVADAGSFHPQQESNVSVDFISSKKGLIRSARLRLPERVRDEISRWAIGPGTGGKSIHYGFHYRMSDSKDRFLRTLFLRDSDPILHVRVECRSTSESLKAITTALAEDGFNILSAFVTPVVESRTRLELVLRLRGPHQSETHVVKNAFRASLAKVAHGLEISFGFPDNYHKDWKRSTVRPAPKSSGRFQVAALTPQEQATRLMEMTRADIEKSVGEIYSDDEERIRLNFLRRLSNSRERLFSASPSPTVFISCHYQNPEEVRMLEDCARSLNYRVVTGEHLKGQKDLRAAIRGAMDACDLYLGVWSLSGAIRSSETWWPSPWLVWEAGVAHALSLPTHLLVSNQIEKEAWKRIYSDLPVSKFTEASFEKEARALLQAIRRSIRINGQSFLRP